VFSTRAIIGEMASPNGVHHVEPNENHIRCRSHRGVDRERSHARECGRAKDLSAESAGQRGTGRGRGQKLLPLMETDNDGKVSKQEFMSFMEAEFDRLDQKKEGKLDVKELTQLPKNGFHK
jgi:hypothetical protein